MKKIVTATAILTSGISFLLIMVFDAGAQQKDDPKITEKWPPVLPGWCC